jgi:hypothetical protein
MRQETIQALFPHPVLLEFYFFGTDYFFVGRYPDSPEQNKIIALGQLLGKALNLNRRRLGIECPHHSFLQVMPISAHRRSVHQKTVPYGHLRNGVLQCVMRPINRGWSNSYLFLTGIKATTRL